MRQRNPVGTRLAGEGDDPVSAAQLMTPSRASLAHTGLCVDHRNGLNPPETKNAPDREIRGVFVQAAKFTSLSHLQT